MNIFSCKNSYKITISKINNKCKKETIINNNYCRNAKTIEQKGGTAFAVPPSIYQKLIKFKQNYLKHVFVVEFVLILEFLVTLLYLA